MGDNELTPERLAELRRKWSDPGATEIVKMFGLEEGEPVIPLLIDALDSAKGDAEYCRKALKDCQREMDVAMRQRDAAEKTIQTITTMLGWMNVPPPRVIEQEIKSLRDQVKRAVELAQAEEIMIRRKWSPVYVPMNGDWTVFDDHLMPLTDEARSGSPSKALIAAEEWMKKREAKP